MKQAKAKHLVLAAVLVLAAAGAIVFVNDYLREREAEADIAALEAESAQQEKASADFIAAKAKEPSVEQIDTTGVYAKKLQTAEDGTKTPALQSKVKVTYRMQLPDGTVADERTEPVEMSPANLIPGAQAALLRMHPGEEWEIYIPQEKGYGAHGAGSIPPFSALVFRVKLVSIED